MKKRRFSITQEEASVIITACDVALDSLTEMMRHKTESQEVDAYFYWLYAATTNIRTRLENYNWEVTKNG